MGWEGDQKAGRPGTEVMRMDRKVQGSTQEAQPGFNGEPTFEGKLIPYLESMHLATAPG